MRKLNYILRLYKGDWISSFSYQERGNKNRLGKVYLKYCEQYK